MVILERCEICTDHEDSSEAGKLQKLYIKGYENLIEQCRCISHSSLLERLERKWTSNIPIAVHHRCRALFLQKEPDVEEEEHEPRLKCQKVSQSGRYVYQFHTLTCSIKRSVDLANL